MAILFSSATLFFLFCFFGLTRIAAGSEPDASLPSRANQAQSTTASITGRVTLSGKAASGVRVVALPVSSSQISQIQDLMQRRESLNTATTDGDGKYELTGLQAGSYEVLAHAPAYISPGQRADGSPGSIIKLAEGETRADVNLTLIRGGVISGRVMDEDGRPQIGQAIKLVRVNEGREPEPFNPVYVQPVTDDRGVYRAFGLPPGQYRVSAGGADLRAAVLSGLGVSKPTETYYPGVIESNLATLTEVKAGSETSGIDIKVGKPPLTYKASGRIVDQDGNPLANMTPACVLIPADGSHGREVPKMGTPTEASGDFRFEGLKSGRYNATVLVAADGSDFYADSVNFDIKNGDANGLEIVMRQGASISGTVAVESDPNASSGANLSQVVLIAFGIGAQPQGLPNIARSKITPDGSFQLHGIKPGRVQFRLIDAANRPPLAMVRIENDGIGLTEDIVIGEGEQRAGVRIAVAKGTNVLAGKIKIEGGPFPPGAQVFVNARRVSYPGAEPKFATASSDLQFSIDGLVPGQYVLTAIVQAGQGMIASSVPQEVVVGTGSTNATVLIHLSPKTH